MMSIENAIKLITKAPNEIYLPRPWKYFIAHGRNAKLYNLVAMVKERKSKEFASESINYALLAVDCGR